MEYLTLISQLTKGSWASTFLRKCFNKGMMTCNLSRSSLCKESVSHFPISLINGRHLFSTGHGRPLEPGPEA